MHCVPLTTTIGAEVHDLDLADLADDGFAWLEAALLRHKVLMVRGQTLDDRSQRDLAARFGPVRRFPFGSPVDEAVPEVHAIAGGGPGPKAGNADVWHSDATFQPAPPLGTVLRAVELPTTGGDTLFADTEAAFAALSPAVQAMLLGLTATHDVAKSSAHRTPREDFPPVHHPVVRAHPVTGRPSLFVNRIFTVAIDGLTERENEVLLPMLCDHVRSPDFQVRLRWEPGSVAIWDNRCTQHYAVADYAQRRVMHRVVIDGTPPVAATA
ncbi:MAG: TauD/TfdA family dioxygenase [Acidimicrobiales bacterium]|jgi:taurine dioxygenase|nr:TauD/TfdA family dioxygenase [Acidimicrobiales bacterium]